MNIFLEYRTKQATIFAWQNDFYALFSTNNEKHILNKHFRAPVVTQFIVKVYRKSKKKSHFWKFIISLFVIDFRM